MTRYSEDPPSVDVPASPVAALMAAHVGRGGMTIREFVAHTMDPKSGYSPSTTTAWKMAHGKQVQVSPELVRAVAVGLGVPLDAVQTAFAVQYITGPREGS